MLFLIPSSFSLRIVQSARSRKTAVQNKSTTMNRCNFQLTFSMVLIETNLPPSISMVGRNNDCQDFFTRPEKFLAKRSAALISCSKAAKVSQELRIFHLGLSEGATGYVSPAKLLRKDEKASMRVTPQSHHDYVLLGVPFFRTKDEGKKRGKRRRGTHYLCCYCYWVFSLLFFALFSPLFSRFPLSPLKELFEILCVWTRRTPAAGHLRFN